MRAKKPQRLPVVLTADEVRRVLPELSGSPWLVACLLYGSGLRLMEAVRLRVKDLDFDHRDVRTTQIYTHVLQRGGSAVISPLNALLGS